MADIELTRYHVEEWIKNIATGEFHYTNVLGLRNKLEPIYDNKLRKIMHDLCVTENPICESVGRHDGYYRPIQDGVVPIDFTGTEEHKDFPIILPFNLRKYIFVYPETAGIVAGSKSAGKTGFLYQIVKLNLGKVNIRILSNMEGGREQMFDRFNAMGVDLREWPGMVLPVDENFHDYVKEHNTIYIIDYIDVPDGVDFYLIGASITKVRRKLKGLNSVAVIGLQKPFDRDLAFGKEQTLKDATFYLAMDDKKLKIVDAKVHTDKKVNPKNMAWTFQYEDEGTRFVNIQQSWEA